jgi:hypothetical protein
MFQDVLCPVKPKEDRKLPQLEGPCEFGILESGIDHSVGLEATSSLSTNDEVLASPIAGSVPSGNR